MDVRVVFKVVARPAWEAASQAGAYTGSPDDQRDGFIHLSAADQLAGTLARHFAGQRELLLVAVDANSLGEQLRWEPSRNGQLFPHLYGTLSLDSVLWVKPIETGPDGDHQVPDLST